jgi:hypothetical protein
MFKFSPALAVAAINIGDILVILALLAFIIAVAVFVTGAVIAFRRNQRAVKAEAAYKRGLAEQKAAQEAKVARERETAARIRAERQKMFENETTEERTARVKAKKAAHREQERRHAAKRDARAAEDAKRQAARSVWSALPSDVQRQIQTTKRNTKKAEILSSYNTTNYDSNTLLMMLVGLNMATTPTPSYGGSSYTAPSYGGTDSSSYRSSGSSSSSYDSSSDSSGSFSSFGSSGSDFGGGSSFSGGSFGGDGGGGSW